MENTLKDYKRIGRVHQEYFAVYGEYANRRKSEPISANNYAINLFISWELMPIDYGKIRVLNVTKSAKKRAENLGVTVRGNPRVLITCRLSLAQSSSEESPLQIL